MKIILQLLCLFLLHTQQVLSNNVQVSNVRLTGQNTTDDFTMVEFDITWENSWRYSGGPANWDAAWVFVKYRVGTGGEWQHVWLNNTGHNSCSNTSITTGLLSPSLPFHLTTNPCLGIFLYRSVAGVGNISCQNVQLRWNYGTNDVTDNAQVDVKVFAIEMVYIPQGSFYVGSGGTEAGAFYTYPTTTSPYFIDSEVSIMVGTSTGNLYYNNATGNSGDQIGPIPTTYPKGYSAFYAMKYEISQQSYTDFLNTLTRLQQITRVSTNISGVSITNRYVLSQAPSPIARNYISCRTYIPAQPGQVEFFCDYSGNQQGSETNDGHSVACNDISWADVVAYMDWASLRPMTEFEFEKCGRGPVLPYANEFAWGNAIYYNHTGVFDFALATERPIELIANATGTNSNGPLRNGAFARINSDRVNSGAGYYGCMELSTNLAERGITVGHPMGRSYTGEHGNGLLSASGDADVTLWPTSASGYFVRGGAWYDEATGSSMVRAMLSQRIFGAYPTGSRDFSYGGRGVRSAQ